VPVGEEDHCGVALAPVAPRGLDQRVYLVRREVLAGAWTQSGPAWLGGGQFVQRERRRLNLRPHLDFGNQRPDTAAMGVARARHAKLKADRAARFEAELVVDRWNRRLATGRDMLWSPTIRAALTAERRGSMCSARGAAPAERSICAQSIVTH
jgi:hypothetical protein